MKITILCVGKLKERYWREAAAEYIKRLSGYATLQTVEIADESIPQGASPGEEEYIRHKETAGLLNRIPRRDFVIALDLSGNKLTSEGLSRLLEKQTLTGVSGFTFVIGGSLGFSTAMSERADYSLSMSDMTFPHQLARVILLEQIYRAFKILREETYHK